MMANTILMGQHTTYLFRLNVGTATLYFCPKVWLTHFITGRWGLVQPQGNQVSHNLWLLCAHLDFPLMSKVYACCSRNDCALALLVVDQWQRSSCLGYLEHRSRLLSLSAGAYCNSSPTSLSLNHWIYDTKLLNSTGKTQDISGLLAKFPRGPAHSDETPSGALARPVLFQVQVLRFLWKYRCGW